MRLADLQPRTVTLMGIVDQKPKRAPYRKAVNVTCETCGKIFKRKPSKVDLGTVRYCSRECKNESQRKPV